MSEVVFDLVEHCFPCLLACFPASMLDKVMACPYHATRTLSLCCSIPISSPTPSLHLEPISTFWQICSISVAIVSFHGLLDYYGFT